ncbi:hypothetical protein C0991_005072, partial [Blastosporella zonata]
LEVVPGDNKASIATAELVFAHNTYIDQLDAAAAVAPLPPPLSTVPEVSPPVAPALGMSGPSPARVPIAAALISDPAPTQMTPMALGAGAPVASPATPSPALVSTAAAASPSPAPTPSLIPAILASLAGGTVDDNSNDNNDNNGSNIPTYGKVLLRFDIHILTILPMYTDEPSTQWYCMFRGRSVGVFAHW